MTITELRYVIALAQVKHFGKAAKLCYISQPTLSVAINKLESELGIAIFERNRNTVEVTDIGKQIIAQAQRTLDEIAKLKDIAKKGCSHTNTPLKVGAIHTIGPYLFPHLVQKLKNISPDMPLYIQEDYTANLHTKLIRGELDVIFISLPFNSPGIVTHALYDEPFVILMRKDHLLNKKNAVKASDLKAEEMLLLGEDHCFRNQVIKACPNCYSESTMQKTVEGTSLETLRHMVASGMGLTVLPSTATQIEYYQSILCTKQFLGKIPKRRVAMAYRVSFTRPKAITALMQGIKACSIRDITLLQKSFVE